jgi:hypothetical protein
VLAGKAGSDASAESADARLDGDASAWNDFEDGRSEDRIVNNSLHHP